jgi:hypothetical protein
MWGLDSGSGGVRSDERSHCCQLVSRGFLCFMRSRFGSSGTSSTTVTVSFRACSVASQSSCHAGVGLTSCLCYTMPCYHVGVGLTSCLCYTMHLVAGLCAHIAMTCTATCWQLGDWEASAGRKLLDVQMNM